MEFSGISSNCGTPLKLSRSERERLLGQHLEMALRLADDLELWFVGIGLDQAIQSLDAMTLGKRPPQARTGVA